LVKNNSCDIDKLTWPRHADGTCDYRLYWSMER
jgi:hypothetical protein